MIVRRARTENKAIVCFFFLLQKEAEEGREGEGEGEEQRPSHRAQQYRFLGGICISSNAQSTDQAWQWTFLIARLLDRLIGSIQQFPFPFWLFGWLVGWKAGNGQWAMGDWDWAIGRYIQCMQWNINNNMHFPFAHRVSDSFCATRYATLVHAVLFSFLVRFSLFLWIAYLYSIGSIHSKKKKKKQEKTNNHPPLSHTLRVGEIENAHCIAPINQPTKYPPQSPSPSRRKTKQTKTKKNRENQPTEQPTMSQVAEDTKSREMWGDVEEEEDMFEDEQQQQQQQQRLDEYGSDQEEKGHIQFPSRIESEPDAKGFKTIEEYFINDKKEKIKLVRTVRIVKKKINKRILERRKWKKFGDCEGMKPGPERNITMTAFDDIKLDFRQKKKETEQDSAAAAAAGKMSIIICRNCGETGHWTLRCPNKKRISASAGDLPPSSPTKGATTPSAASDAPKRESAYVIPSRRGAEMEARDKERQERELGTIRVTNISQDTSEDDLYELFAPFGRVQRIYLAKDRQTQQSKGFAFVNFTDRESAARAIQRLNGHGYDSRILKLEWAKPRES